MLPQGVEGRRKWQRRREHQRVWNAAVDPRKAPGSVCRHGELTRTALQEELSCCRQSWEIPDVPLSNGIAAPSLALSQSRSPSSPRSHVPAKMGFHLLRCKGGDGGTCSGFTFPGTESGLVPRLFQQLKERKGMFLSFLDAGRGFCSHQGGADAFPSSWLPARG